MFPGRILKIQKSRNHKIKYTMKKLVLIAGIMLSYVLVSAQNPLEKGKFQLNAGVGFSNWGLPLYVGFDYGIHEDISIGGEFVFHSYNEEWDHYHYTHNVFSIAFTANYHFNRILKMPSDWDFYAGANVGINFWNSPGDYPGDHHTSVGLGVQVGGRYFFNEHFGLNLEVGGGNAASGGKFGITYQF